MNRSGQAGHSGEEALENEAFRDLKDRPSLSIRARISLGFFLLFALSLGIMIASIVILYRIQDKLMFLEAVDNYTFEIQQARRYEKNYFLYGTNLDDALQHAHRAEKIFGNVKDISGHVRRYAELLEQLKQSSQNNDPGSSLDYSAIEEELRRHGAEMVSVANEMVARENKSINTMLIMSQRIPIVFLLVLLMLSIYLTNFIARQMLRPLNRLMEATARIAEGDFTPIGPHRRYRDEFSKLALTMNRMMSQLQLRQDLLVRAHKLNAVGTLTAGVAHELNNPINNIMITASMLMEDYADLSDEDKLDMASDLLEQAERARKIVRNLLDFARESEISMEPLAPNELVEETIQLAHNQIKLSNVKIETDFAAELPLISGDRQQLKQVFLNIILNALDAMPETGTLTVSTSLGKSGEFVIVRFSDTGMGIPELIRNSIFDPFFSTKKRGKGTGLGLSVSLGIIQKHGGEIRVKSQPGNGAAFTITLPVIADR